MAAPFRQFVILGVMRSGSNLLERTLAAYPGLACHGELFNPAFVGGANRDAAFGIDRAARDADPLAMLAAMRAADPGAIPGFRFFPDHDPRVLAHVLDDPTCAKVILTRDPVDSFVSLEIARETDSWLISDIARRRTARIRFDIDKFARYRERLSRYYADLRRGLQIRGQTAFEIDYTRLRDREVMNGLARYLGARGTLDRLPEPIKRQNPPAFEDKVTNSEEARAGLARLGALAAPGTAAPQPGRGAQVPRMVLGRRVPILFAPIPGAPEARISGWMAGLEAAAGAPADPDGPLISGLNRRTLSEWMTARPGLVSLSVVRHPLARAWTAFMTRIWARGPGSYATIRAHLARSHALVLPDGPDGPDPDDPKARGAAFAGFLRFVKANLAGQTPIREDGMWISQTACIAGFAPVVPIQMVLREDRLGTDLPALADRFGLSCPPLPLAPPEEDPPGLAAVATDRLEALARQAYAQDYAVFGFDDWQAG